MLTLLLAIAWIYLLFDVGGFLLKWISGILKLVILYWFIFLVLSWFWWVIIALPFAIFLWYKFYKYYKKKTKFSVKQNKFSYEDFVDKVDVMD